MKLLFPVTNRVHEARQKLLLDELSKSFEIHICNYGEKDMSMTELAVDISAKFKDALEKIKPDVALIRGDRFEQLPLAMLCVYAGVPIVHLEAGDLSGVIDNKVRYAISHLADLHFATNSESEDRLLRMGFEKVYNYGSLDVEYALECSQTLKIAPGEEYLLVLYHEIPGEDRHELDQALDNVRIRKIDIKGNSDYKQGQGEEYPPQEFIGLLKNALCVIGNSSAGIKECSILGTPVVNIGSRQKNRLKTPNVLDIECMAEGIHQAIKYQLNVGHYEPSGVYYQPDTSKRIAQEIINFTKAYQMRDNYSYMSPLDKTHKELDKEKTEAIEKLNKEMADKFVRFQLDNNVRAIIINPFAQDVIVAMVMDHAKLMWREMESEEKEAIQRELAKKQGIELPQ